MRDDFTASLRSACPLRNSHFVSYLKALTGLLFINGGREKR
ncbi:MULTISPECIES: gluconate 5-dehydrogenase [Yersinia]|uniref:Gluconate 5-dehydrogenase n=1 Tax=Yersinia massiliensis TaxID=419257 RepID=A0ABM6V0X1_9GAMM|nr:gluconate 5-dehydrogenase [Yersinia massiliensis]